MLITQKKSAMIEALQRFCEEHSDDPNLFPPDKDTSMLGIVMTDYPKCDSDDLSSIKVARLRDISGIERIGTA